MNTNLSFDQRYYSYDAVQAEFRFDTDDGVTTDDRGTDVWWDAQRSVSASDVPSYYNDFFDAERYYSIDTVVAKEVPQQYHIGDNEYTFIKPNDELKKAAWSLDGKPYTLTHPSEGAVRSTDEIHGFWGQPRHDSEAQESRATLYFPTNDGDAREFVANHDNVSVGFVNTLVKSDRDGIAAEQTDIYYDHAASVKRGRCSDEDGCGLQGFASGADSADYVSASAIAVEEMKDGITHPDSSVTNDSINDSNTNNDTMSCECDSGTTDGGLALELDDFGVRKVREENDAVDAELSAKEQRIEELEGEIEASSDAKGLLTTLADDMGVEDGSELHDAVKALQDSYAEIQEEMEEYRTDERDELLSELKERTDSEYHDAFKQTDDESVTDHISRLSDKLETVKMVKGDSSPTTVTPTTTDSTSDGESEFSSESGATIDATQFADVQF